MLTEAEAETVVGGRMGFAHAAHGSAAVFLGRETLPRPLLGRYEAGTAFGDAAEDDCCDCCCERRSGAAMAAASVTAVSFSSAVAVASEAIVGTITIRRLLPPMRCDGLPSP